jgi:hypothetical protein
MHRPEPTACICVCVCVCVYKFLSFDMKAMESVPGTLVGCLLTYSVHTKEDKLYMQ